MWPPTAPRNVHHFGCPLLPLKVLFTKLIWDMSSSFVPDCDWDEPPHLHCSALGHLQIIIQFLNLLKQPKKPIKVSKLFQLRLSCIIIIKTTKHMTGDAALLHCLFSFPFLRLESLFVTETLESITKNYQFRCLVSAMKQRVAAIYGQKKLKTEIYESFVLL